jgi:ABC-type lipoprotein export system ATPase subunit
MRGTTMTGSLELRGVGKTFNARGGDTLALDGIDLHVEPGEFVCIVGASGCGKSTLLNIVAGLTEPTAGEALIDGEPIEGPGPDRGLVFQGYSLYPWKTVSDNIAFGLEIEGVKRSERQRRVDRYLDVMDLRKWKDARPSQLSGGMRQRVAIARSLVTEEVPLRDVEPHERAHHGVCHEPGLVGQHGDRHECLGKSHDGVVAHRAQVAALRDSPPPGNDAVEDRDQGRHRHGAHEETGPQERRNARQGPRRRRQEKRRWGNEASTKIVDHLPSAQGGDARPRSPASGVARVAQDPGDELPVAAHPAMLAARGHLVVRGELLEEIHVRQQPGACEQALEEIVAEKRVLRCLSVERRLEGLDVVDPLPGVGPFFEEVLVHIGDRGRVGVHAPGTRDDALVGRAGGPGGK